MVIYTRSQLKLASDEEKMRYFQSLDNKKTINIQRYWVDTDEKSFSEHLKFLDSNGVCLDDFIRVIQVPSKKLVQNYNLIYNSDKNNDNEYFKQKILNMLNKIATLKTTREKIFASHVMFVFLLRFGYPIIKTNNTFKATVYGKLVNEEFQRLMDSTRYIPYFDNIVEYNMLY